MPGTLITLSTRYPLSSVATVSGFTVAPPLVPKRSVQERSLTTLSAQLTSWKSLAPRDHLTQLHCLRGEAQVLAGHIGAARLLGRAADLLGLRCVERGRLLAEHVLACAHGPDGDGRMERVGRGDADGVHRVAGHQ